MLPAGSVRVTSQLLRECTVDAMLPGACTKWPTIADGTPSATRELWASCDGGLGGAATCAPLRAALWQLTTDSIVNIVRATIVNSVKARARSIVNIVYLSRQVWAS